MGALISAIIGAYKKAGNSPGQQNTDETQLIDKIASFIKSKNSTEEETHERT